MTKSKAAAEGSLEWLSTLGLALLAALVLRIVVFQPFTIPSASMEPGLREGDYIIVSKFSHGWSRHSIPFSPPLPGGRLMGSTPKRGEVVVFKLPRDIGKSYVKRVIGLPGDRVQLVGGVVHVNGRPIARSTDGNAIRERLAAGASWLTYDRGPGYPGDDTPVYVVPKDQLFMLGDNRDNSIDSRWPRETGVGFVPIDNVQGRAELILVSWRQGASLFKPWTWVTHLDPERMLRGLS